MSALSRLKSLSLSLAEQEEILDIFDSVESELSGYNENELKELADLLVEVIKVRKGMVGKRAEEILSKIYPKVKNRVVSLLWADDAFLRNTALKIISMNKDRSVLYELIKDKDKDIRKFALDIAFEIGDSEFIKKGLDDEDINVVISSAEYLARLGDGSALNRIVDIFRKIPEDDLYSALFILESLLKLRYPKTAELIKEKFGEEINDPIIKPVYVKACGFTGDKKYIDTLLDFLSDEDVRKEAIEGLIYFVRETKLDDKEKAKIKDKIQSEILHFSPSEIEEANKILNMLSE